jgi:CheY-like chemotaxis protein
VYATRSGKQAIRIYKKHRREIDLVILDMVMPQMGGKEVFEQLRAINPDIKVLLASGYSKSGQASAILDQGCNGFIQKPFNSQELSLKIRAVLDGIEE